MRTRIWLLLLMGGFPMLGFSQTELNFSGKVTDMQGFFRQNQHYTFNQFQQRFELDAHLLPQHLFSFFISGSLPRSSLPTPQENIEAWLY